MTVVIVGMLTALLIAGIVVALVAVPARREGREVLSPQGELLVQNALERTADAVGVARDKVGDLADRLPVPSRSDDQAAQVEAPRTIDLREQRDDRSSSAAQHRAS
ncbi:hypothetical protein ACPPVT_14625 [Angustibacter sp. McL0619]|uniref:hypothetical protein n=1 Tax=Angustibacter sp. McL0619 TaxID=3415676 RepID=UPI003CEC400A